MTPDGPVIEKAVMGTPCGACLWRDKWTSYESFADRLITRVISRSGIKDRYPKPKIGAHIDPDEDAKFLHTPPPAHEDPEGLRRWLGRLTAILRNPERQYLHSQVMERLVPISDPLRYEDDRIDAALLDVLHRGLKAGPELKRLEHLDPQENFDASKFPDNESLEKELHRLEEEAKPREQAEDRLRGEQFIGLEAARRLGYHGAAGAFPELLQLAKEPSQVGDYHAPLLAVASIAGRHPGLRPAISEMITHQLSDAEEGVPRGSPILEAIWRADLRDLTPLLEKVAALASPAASRDDERDYAIKKASLILMTWRETDALTKTKMHMLLTAAASLESAIPEVLRAEFSRLPPEKQLEFRQFVMWLRTVNVGFSRRFLEDAFTPHTPRPDIWLERWEER